jgi:hypothetical protein
MSVGLVDHGNSAADDIDPGAPGPGSVKTEVPGLLAGEVADLIADGALDVAQRNGTGP